VEVAKPPQTKFFNTLENGTSLPRLGNSQHLELTGDYLMKSSQRKQAIKAMVTDKAVMQGDFSAKDVVKSQEPLKSEANRKNEYDGNHMTIESKKQSMNYGIRV